MTININTYIRVKTKTIIFTKCKMAQNILNLSIKQLKEQYKKEDDDFLKLMIKKVIQLKEKQNIAKATTLRSRSIVENNEGKQNKNRSKKIDDLLDNLIDENMQSNEPPKPNVDERYLEEIKFDHANNKLMERMNSEVDMRIYSGTNKKKFSSPFADDRLLNDGEYVSYKDFEKQSSITDFRGFNPR